MGNKKRQKNKRLARRFVARQTQGMNIVFMRALIRFQLARIIVDFFMQSRCFEIRMYEFQYGKIGGAI